MEVATEIKIEEVNPKEFYEACELCGDEIKYKTGKRKRQMDYHLHHVHFKSKHEQEHGQEIDKSFPHCPIKNCPSSSIKFIRSKLLYHLSTTHRFMDYWLKEELKSRQTITTESKK